MLFFFQDIQQLIHYAVCKKHTKWLIIIHSSGIMQQAITLSNGVSMPLIGRKFLLVV